MYKKYFVPVLFLLISFPVFAQNVVKEITPQRQLWLAFFNQTRLSDRWGLWLDLHARTIGDDFANRWNTQIFRPGVTYFLSDQVRLTAGYAYVRHYPATSDGDVRPEHRPWQQLAWSGRLGRFYLNQWIRAEQRYNRRTSNGQLQDGYTFNHRFRYMFFLQIPLTKPQMQPGVPNFVFQNELHLNAGKQITYNYFDQNRFFVGFSYPFSKSLTLQAGYMNLFQQLPAGNRFANNHVARLFLFQTLDFRQ
ncbi:DUF2490 domain-containing protein [Tellurirhabdus rosea]|uniref:DUF2490 domain-containing protein n=1 Tax=Tellurirhabdus rosea TaxID=2674997 RepID=UPI00225A7968|nr:DUF2490 domain-containing protein [Tellurirhabdus rosea]